jgi:proline iminopeptidase
MEAIRIAYGIDRWIVGGHSWGADLALMYALAHPERTQGIVCLAGGRISNDVEWFGEFRRRSAIGKEELPKTTVPPNKDVYDQVLAGWKNVLQRPLLLHDLANLQISALFVYGDQDLRPGWPVEQVARLLPQARYISILGAPHLLWFTHPEVVEGALRDFMTMVKRE